MASNLLVTKMLAQHSVLAAAKFMCDFPDSNFAADYFVFWWGGSSCVTLTHRFRGECPSHHNCISCVNIRGCRIKS